MSQLTTLSLILAAAVTGALAQSFDVATIKPNAANDDHFFFRHQQSSLTATGVTLKFLVAEGYGVRAYQISGGQGWIGTERWDIQAKAEGVKGRLSADQHQAMLHALLADRFQLKVHRETKELPVYALLVAKNGSKVVPHTNEATSPEKEGMGAGRLNYTKMTTAKLARMLSGVLGRPVVDKTGLDGVYDFRMEWAPEPSQDVLVALGLPPSPQPMAPAPADSGRPSIFTAVQEQLGLRLESQKGPVEIIVIDHAERPSEN